MLQKVDKARHDKVSKVLETLNLRFPNSEISNKLGMDKGVVSSYLNGKKPMSDNFYTNFMEEFGKGFKEETISAIDSPINKTESQNLEALIESNKMLSKANMDLAANIVVLTNMLNSSDQKEKILTASTIRAEALELLAPLVKDSLGLEHPTDSKALLELDRRLTEIEKKKKLKSS